MAALPGDVVGFIGSTQSHRDSHAAPDKSVAASISRSQSAGAQKQAPQGHRAAFFDRYQRYKQTTKQERLAARESGRPEMPSTLQSDHSGAAVTASELTVGAAGRPWWTSGRDVACEEETPELNSASGSAGAREILAGGSVSPYSRQLHVRSSAGERPCLDVIAPPGADRDFLRTLSEPMPHTKYEEDEAPIEDFKVPQRNLRYRVAQGHSRSEDDEEEEEVLSPRLAGNAHPFSPLSCIIRAHTSMESPSEILRNKKEKWQRCPATL